MAASVAARKPAAKGRPTRAAKSAGKLEVSTKSAPGLEKANRRRREIAALKADARGGRLAPADLLTDPRARSLNVLTLLSMVPRCTLRVVFEALLVCQINGARECGDLSVG